MERLPSSHVPNSPPPFLDFLSTFTSEKNALGILGSIGHKVVTDFTVVLPLKSTSPLRLESRTSATLWTRGLSLSSGTERNSFTLIAPDLSRSNLWKRFSSLKFETSENEGRNTNAHGSFCTCTSYIFASIHVDIIIRTLFQPEPGNFFSGESLDVGQTVCVPHRPRRWRWRLYRSECAALSRGPRCR